MKSTTKKIILIITSLILATGIALGVYFAVRGKEEEPPTEPIDPNRTISFIIAESAYYNDVKFSINNGELISATEGETLELQLKTGDSVTVSANCIASKKQTYKDDEGYKITTILHGFKIAGSTKTNLKTTEQKLSLTFTIEEGVESYSLEEFSSPLKLAPDTLLKPEKLIKPEFKTEYKPEFENKLIIKDLLFKPEKEHLLPPTGKINPDYLIKR